MSPTIPGIHHVTAITADAQKNVDFYCGVLGLRLVKLTVNFDDPASYHLYYGDDLGHPGTIMTFFAWPGAYRGWVGPPQATVTAFAIPTAAHDYWLERLDQQGITVELTQRMGERVIGIADPDGLKLELIADQRPADAPNPPAGPVPPRFAIRAFHGVTLSEEGYEETARLLTDVMGFRASGSEANRFRYRAAGGDAIASTVDVLCVPAARRGSMGAGVVHHVAFRTPDDAQQEAWRQALVGRGSNVSPVMNRVYFHSIYYREPGGVLFEIATDSPGFTVDESPQELGTALKLPPWLEPHRAEIEPALPPIRLPNAFHAAHR